MRNKITNLILVLAILLLSACESQHGGNILVIDDFEGAISRETVDFGYGLPASLDVQASKDVVYHGGQSLKIIYDAAPDGYMWVARGYGLDVKGAAQWLVVPEKIDWRKYKSLSFYMHGEDSGVMIAVDIIDDGFEYWRFIIHDNFAGWKQIICPLEGFFPRGDWQPDKADKNAELDFPIRAFQFEPRPTAKGVIYIDYVHLIR